MKSEISLKELPIKVKLSPSHKNVFVNACKRFSPPSPCKDFLRCSLWSFAIFAKTSYAQQRFHLLHICLEILQWAKSPYTKKSFASENALKCFPSEADFRFFREEKHIDWSAVNLVTSE